MVPWQQRGPVASWLEDSMLCVSRCILRRIREVIDSLCSALVKLHLDTVWGLNWRLLSRGLSSSSGRNACPVRRSLSLEKRWLWEDTRAALVERLSKRQEAVSFTVLRSKRSNGHELQQGKSQLAIKRKIHCEDNQTEEQDAH